MNEYFPKPQSHEENIKVKILVIIQQRKMLKILGIEILQALH